MLWALHAIQPLVLLVLLSCHAPVASLTLLPSQRTWSSAGHHASFKFNDRKTTFNSNWSGGTISRRSSLHMKDSSCSYWFNVGDRVKVQSSVKKAGIELKGRTGEVIETWEKCDVDPTCCCAEFVDDNFAVTVKFQGKLSLDPSPDSNDGDSFIKGIDNFTHYFSEDELLKLKVTVADPNEESESSSSSGQNVSVPFDGMSCVAFKLEHLKMGKQAQRIGAYEASASDEESESSEDSNVD